MRIKLIKNILMALFLLYWLLAGLKVFLPNNTLDNFKNHFLTANVLPPVYKMYTSPPKERIVSFYTYYQKKEKLYRINADSLFHVRMKKNFPWPAFKKDLKQYQSVYYQPSLDITNFLFKYYYDSLQIQEEDIPFQLSQNKRLNFKFENKLQFADNIGQSIPELASADSVVVQVYKYFNPLKMDPNINSKPAAGIPDMLLFEKGKNFKNAQ
ncbi:MAG: hypothetical protein Q4G27_03375 [Flavobacteriaceae bacterium]|nr:hypothetical protein [Flavobacteriaceae bacterium]